MTLQNKGRTLQVVVPLLWTQAVLASVSSFILVSYVVAGPYTLGEFLSERLVVGQPDELRTAVPEALADLFWPRFIMLCLPVLLQVPLVMVCLVLLHRVADGECQ